MIHIVKETKKQQRKRKREQEKDLPHDIMVEILLRLPVKSLRRFRCVCKSWNSLTRDSSFIDANYRGRAVHKSVISLNTTCPAPTLAKLDLSGRPIDEFILTDTPQKDYCLSNFVHGLSCLYREFTCYVLNPATREFIRLPEERSNDFIMGLGFDTCTSEYKVVRSSKYGWEILTVGSNERRSINDPMLHQVVSDTDRFDSVRCPAIYMHGSLHWRAVNQTSTRGILSLHVNEGKFAYVPDPGGHNRQSPLPPESFQPLLLELDEHLCMASTDHQTMNVLEIWKLKDYAGRIWSKEYSIILHEVPMAKWPNSTLETQNSHLLQIDSQGVICYDLRKKTFRRLKNFHGNQFILYTESLVSLKNLIK